MTAHNKDKIFMHFACVLSKHLISIKKNTTKHLVLVTLQSLD